MTTTTKLYEISVISLGPGHIAVLLYDSSDRDPLAGWELHSASPLGRRVVEFQDQLKGYHPTEKVLAFCGIDINADHGLRLETLDRLIDTVVQQGTLH